MTCVREKLVPTFQSSCMFWMPAQALNFLVVPASLRVLYVGTCRYCTVLYCTVLYCTVLYCTVLYCTVMYCTVLYCTVLYYRWATGTSHPKLGPACSWGPAAPSQVTCCMCRVLTFDIDVQTLIFST